MPSPRHTSKLEQTCQRGAFDSCSRAASGLEPGTEPPAPLSARGAVQVERATPVLGSIRRASGPAVRREHLVEQAEPVPPGAWRPPSRPPAQVRRSIDVLCKVRQALASRSASAWLALGERAARGARPAPHRGGGQEIAARRARLAARHGEALTDQATPCAGRRTRLFDKSANLDGCANPASHPTARRHHA